MSRRIIFTGAQGTGKTTILNHYKEQGHNVITEVVRNLAKKGVKINKDGDEKGQTKIFKEYEKLLGENTSFISDRGLIDVTAYTVYLARQGKVSEEYADKQLKKLSKFLSENSDIVYCYFPVEFDVVADGTRDLDEEYRSDINQIILSLLGAFGMSFVVVAGTVEERIAKVDQLFNWLNTADSLFARIDTQSIEA